MPPARTRAVADEQQPSTKERASNHAHATNKARKNGATVASAVSHSKDTPAAAGNNSTIGGINGPQAGAGGMDWTADDLPLLHRYRKAYQLDVPTAFRSPMNAAILSIPGIGRLSPTMARKRAKRNTSKEQLALTVRKHFNGLAVNETDVVVDFLYKVKTQDKTFKMRFTPSKQK